MLTVVRTIVSAIALFEFLFLLLFPYSRMAEYLREHEKAQVAFGIIFLLGLFSSVLAQFGF